jgi:ribosomal protein S18 acetylase RimI-like enzyme
LQPVIRRVGPADAQTLAAIGRTTFVEAFGHLYPPADLAAFLAETHTAEQALADLADPQTAAWLAELAGETVGYALAGSCRLPHPEASPADGELKRLYLRPRAQNGGVGARLFETASAWLQRDGPRPIWIGVWSQNDGAQRFYGRYGYEKVGEYGFRVGATIDHEFILRRAAESSSTPAGVTPPNRHDLI